jgi:hypothetical protein
MTPPEIRLSQLMFHFTIYPQQSNMLHQITLSMQVLGGSSDNLWCLLDNRPDAVSWKSISILSHLTGFLIITEVRVPWVAGRPCPPPWVTACLVNAHAVNHTRGHACCQFIAMTHSENMPKHFAASSLELYGKWSWPILRRFQRSVWRNWGNPWSRLSEEIKVFYIVTLQREINFDIGMAVKKPVYSHAVVCL